MNAIEIKNLSKIYKKNIQALDDFSLKIPASVVYGIIGPNGAGKSTIMNILAGVLDRTDGDISILGQPISKDDYEYKRKAGFVLENPYYIEKLTIKDYLHFCGAMYEIPVDETKSRTRELLSFFELTDKEGSWIEACSKGMKKKVALAAAMIHQPQLLILDEPLEGMDPISAKKTKDNLRLMSQKGNTVVITSHNLDTVEKFCDEIAIIHQGKLIFEAKTTEIRHKIKNEVTQETYRSLEEIFVDVVSDQENSSSSQKLSWL